MKEDTLLLRQIHPYFVQADQISSLAFATSQAFRPTPKDINLLSVYNGNKFTPEASHKHFTEMNNKSCGVLGLTVAECKGEGLASFENNDPFDGHAVIDFNNLSKGQIDKKAKKLKSIAQTRGWLFRN
ncbi:MAG TPA: hypothetical protein VGC22_14350 [Chitinophaga sp.]